MVDINDWVETLVNRHALKSKNELTWITILDVLGEKHPYKKQIEV